MIVRPTTPDARSSDRPSIDRIIQLDDEYNDENNHNNYNNNQTNTINNNINQKIQKNIVPNINHPFDVPSQSQSRFSTSQSSPCLSDTSNTISFATMNVRGINIQSKFDSILSDFIDSNISVMGFQETRLKERSADINFKLFLQTHSPLHRYRAYWSFDTADPCGGVGLIIAPFVSQYVQRIHRFRSRFIAIDLYLPAKKLKVINIYGYQQNDYKSKGAAFCKYVIDHINQAVKEGFKVIIMGDFNADPSVYMTYLTQGRKPPKHFALVAFLIDNNYIDQY